MSVRRLELGEGTLYRSLRLAALETDPDAFASHADEAAQRPPESWEEVLDSQNIFAAFEDGQAVGLAAWFRQGPEKLRHRGMLSQVWVRPDSRGMGHAGRLVRAVLEDARASGITLMELGYLSSNTAARRLYDGLGFIEVGDIPRGFRLRNGAYLGETMMMLHLD